MFLAIGVGGIIIIVLYFVATYNGFVNLQNKAEEAFATMDAYLKNRWDLIPNLVETVKGYASHERETLESVIQARNMSMNSSNPEELKQNEKNLMAGLKSIFALSERYPDLKANQNFLSLQTQLEKVEKDILNSRKYYNAVVRQFNTKIKLFPHSIIAGIMSLEKKAYFDIDETERQNVKVSFK
ncbi:MAG: LemA family protein [Candidatus Cloacimonetes bacterium]|nr:LemA family protein [Candidatus Cloacimonadota bacterium]